MPRILRILIYGFAFIFSFLFFVYWLFPMDAIKERMITALETQLGADYQVDIEDISTYRFTGAKLENLTFTQLKEGKKFTAFTAERVWVRVGLFSLIFGSPKVHFEVQVGDATIEGRMYTSEAGYQLKIIFDDLDVSQIPWLVLQTGLKFISQTAGELELTYNPKEPLRTTGKLDWRLNQFQLRKGNLSLGEMGSFPLPDLNLADKGSQIKAQIEGGSIQLESFQLKGKDLSLNLQGRLFLAPDISKYRINWKGEFQFSENLWKILDPILPEPFGSNLKAQRAPNGNHPITVSGQLASPQVYSGSVQVFPLKPF